MFYDEKCKKNQTCDLEGHYHDCFGADWWFALDYPHDAELGDLKAFAMKFRAQKAQESAAERHYSLVDTVHTKKQESMQPESLKKQCFF